VLRRSFFLRRRFGRCLLVRRRKARPGNTRKFVCHVSRLPLPALLARCRECETSIVKSTAKKEVRRCRWAQSPAMMEYHDREWGVPLHDDRQLFEFLILEGAQAGLSWETILKKRENYRKAFDFFEPEKIARYDAQKARELMADAGIVRNRLKIAAAVSNAHAYLEVVKKFGSFDRYIWQFAPARAKKREPKAPRRLRRMITRTRESDAMSKDLKRRGFRFVGTTICYAFMQAVGMVNDHAPDCFRRQIQA
jgi:DNA-3-methyladenine glycosylase I